MSTAGRSYAVNLSGTIWLAIIQVAFVPFFIRHGGMEGYGLIGFAVTLQAALQVLDFGFAPTIARWLARFVAGLEDERTARDFGRTLEIGSWTVAVVAGGLLMWAAGPVARMWFRNASLPIATLRWSVALMALMTCAQWPVSFYQSGLLGLGRATAMNVTRGVSMTVGVAAAAVALLFFHTVTAYFAVQAIAGFLQALILRFLFWQDLADSGDTPPRFRTDVLRIGWRFAAGMTGVTFGAVLVMQGDRIVISRLVPLEQFGYYALAWVVAGGLAVVTMPAHNTLFPQFSSLFGRPGLRAAFHRGAQMLSVLLLPLACVIVLFAPAILRVWTGNEAVVVHAAPIVAVLAVGSALNGLMHPPYALQLASGSTRLPLFLTYAQLALIVSAAVVLTRTFGVIGAAYAWAGMNVLYFLGGSLLTFQKFLPGIWYRWIVRDVGVPLIGALLPVLLARRFIEVPAARVTATLMLGAIFVCSILGAAVTAPAVWRKL